MALQCSSYRCYGSSLISVCMDRKKKKTLTSVYVPLHGVHSCWMAVAYIFPFFSAIYRTRHSSSITCFAGVLLFLLRCIVHGRVFCVHFRSILYSISRSLFFHTIPVIQEDGFVVPWCGCKNMDGKSVTYSDFKQLCGTTIFANQIQNKWNRPLCANRYRYETVGIHEYWINNWAFEFFFLKSIDLVLDFFLLYRKYKRTPLHSAWIHKHFFDGRFTKAS